MFKLSKAVSFNWYYSFSEFKIIRLKICTFKTCSFLFLQYLFSTKSEYFVYWKNDNITSKYIGNFNFALAMSLCSLRGLLRSQENKFCT
jgi:hypothetical protein